MLIIILKIINLKKTKNSVDYIISKFNKNNSAHGQKYAKKRPIMKVGQV